MLKFGADIGYQGPHHTRQTPNAVSARMRPDILRQMVQKEVSLGRTRGPFFKPPFPTFICSSLGLVPKKPDGFRLILDLSQPSDDSVNYFIDKDEFSLTYCNIDSAVAILNRLGEGALMAKSDVKSAFRIVPVRTADHHLLVYKLANSYYYDVVLPFGCRSSPYLFCQISEAVRWIVSDLQQHKDILVYLDDFWMAAPAHNNRCQQVLAQLQTTCEELGVPLAPGKTEGPATSLAFLGIWLNTVDQTLSLPEGKKEEIMKSLHGWKSKSSCSKSELQSLIGSLMFASKCVPASRLFIRRLIQHLTGLRRDEHDILLNDDFQLDLQWWLTFLPKWNGRASFLSNDWLSPDVTHLYTDASGTLGLGAYFEGEWFQSRWP